MLKVPYRALNTNHVLAGFEKLANAALPIKLAYEVGKLKAAVEKETKAGQAAFQLTHAQNLAEHADISKIEDEAEKAEKLAAWDAAKKKELEEFLALEVSIQREPLSRDALRDNVGLTANELIALEPFLAPEPTGNVLSS